MIRRAFACATLTASLACAEKPAPPPPSPAASPVAPAPWLRPMTSRESPPAGAEGALPPGHPPLGSVAPEAPAAEAVSGTVRLDPSQKDHARPKGVLFIIARDAERRIVAVRREDVASFPFAFTISGADAMTEGTRFAGPLEITARLSRSGDAVPAAGDVEGVVRGVKVGATNVVITIDSVRQ